MIARGGLAGALGALVMACSSPMGAVDSGALDAGSSEDAGEVSDSGVEMPAPFTNPPRITTLGGPVAKSGKVIPVFFANDALEPTVEAFLAQLSPSPYWTATTKEYGVGDYALGASIVIPEAPAMTSDSEIQSFIATHADGSDPAWPTADPGAVFVLFYPASTTIDVQGSTSCQDFGAYHSETNLADNTAFSYVVVPRCDGIDDITSVTSHELVEWATDSFPMTSPAYGEIDSDHVIWSFGGGGAELGDMCAGWQSSYARILGGFLVQRTWSNASIAAGHDPCVPAPSAPYFNAVPDLPDKIALNFGGGGGLKTKGVRIPAGTSKTIAVRLYSDAPTAAWTLSARDRSGGSQWLSFQWDSNTGQDGDVRELTITSLKATSSGVASFTITSTSAQTKHVWYGLVGQK